MSIIVAWEDDFDGTKSTHEEWHSAENAAEASRTQNEEVNQKFGRIVKELRYIGLHEVEAFH